MPIDFLLIYLLMGILFIRQVTVFRLPDKIDYAPLILGIGAIGSLAHLLFFQGGDTLRMFKESLLPLFAGLILYMIVNILHQAQRRERHRSDVRLMTTLLEHSERLSEFGSRLETHREQIDAQEEAAREALDARLAHDDEALSAMRSGQERFLEEVEAMFARQESLFGRLETFTDKEMPDFDAVIHRHIDMLRIAEQDHFNRLQEALGRIKIPEGISEEMTASLQGLQQQWREAGRMIAREAASDFNRLFDSLQERVGLLRSQGESLSLALKEEASRLEDIGEQSDVLMKQLLLCSENMEGIRSDSGRVRELYAPLEGLVREVSAVHGDYVASKLELQHLVESFKAAEGEEIAQLRVDIEQLDERLNRTIDASIAKLHEHYHIAQREISTSVQELSARAKLQQSYKTE
jgi:hypothetical protein